MNPHQFFGMYRGFVTDVADPNRLGRIMVRIPVVAPPDIETGEYPSFGWAWPVMGSGMGEGIYQIPKRGDQVWVQFEQGDPDRPVYWPGSWTMRGGENNAPLHTQGRYENSDNFARNPDLTGPSAFPPTEPDQISQWNTPAGRVEFNSTPGNERVLLEHKSGSRIEIMPDGTVYIVSTGHVKEVAAGNKTVDISGSERHTHNAPVLHEYKGLTENHVGEVTRSYKAVTEDAGTVTQTYSKLIQKVTSAEISYYGSVSHSYGGGLADGIFGDYVSTITGTAKWLVMNTFGLAPGVAAGVHLSNPAIGDYEVKVGVDPTGLANNSLLIRHPIGKIPGAADLVLKAVAMMSLTAPLVTIGGTEGPLGKEFTVRGVSLLAYINSHIHLTAQGPTGIAVVPAPPTLLSTTTMVM